MPTSKAKQLMQAKQAVENLREALAALIADGAPADSLRDYELNLAKWQARVKKLEGNAYA